MFLAFERSEEKHGAVRVVGVLSAVALFLEGSEVGLFFESALEIRQNFGGYSDRFGLIAFDLHFDSFLVEFELSVAIRQLRLEIIRVPAELGLWWFFLFLPESWLCL